MVSLRAQGVRRFGPPEPLRSGGGALVGALVFCAFLLFGCGEAGEDAPGSSDGMLFPDLAAFQQLPDEPLAGASTEFWEWWGDGRAEVAGYRMHVERYGEPREAELALIYVTEPHDRRTWIKDDGAEEPYRTEVLKLISSATFLTGFYPYSVMTTVFSPVDRYRSEAFSPVRISHSVQEWCGSYSHMLFPGSDRFRSLRLSYFAQHGERLLNVAKDPEALYEDALLIQLRELDGPFAEGGDWEGELVPELWRLRAGHGELEPVDARIRREEGVREWGGEEVPVTRFTLVAEGYERVWDVERNPPRRVLGWRTSTGDEAELLESERLAYWELNRLGDESVRERIGLHPSGSLPPGQEVDPAAPCP